ncbi:MAG TPA: carboxypeptidase regulatory-like domain-containing protein, partial [Kofleriaceae bacterium]|nr:carboxypeptidase regulatory-like domain-containing protein [Kofleriaceae bacterium]
GATGPAAAAPKPAPKTDRPAGKLGPVGERVQLLRDAADQLDKANTALERGNKNLAEQLFSTAELLVGPDALAQLAPMFREGGPPRVTTPTQKVDTSAPPQPKVAGNSEEDDEAAKVAPPKVETGSLGGAVMIDGGKAGTYGLVTLEPASGKWKPRTPKKVVIEQRGREFLPSLVAVSVGSTVSFPNFDAVFHNVFSTSSQAAFDLGLYRAGEAREYTFTKPGIVRVGCNLHANMSAYIAVVSEPSYVVTDAQGNFTFRRLVPGKYKLRAWSIKSKAPIERDVTIKAGKNELSIGVAADAPTGPLPDKFGGKRG